MNTKRRFHFTLRVLLVLTIVLTIPLSLWVNSARRQRRAVESIRSEGGRIYYDDDILPLFYGGRIYVDEDIDVGEGNYYVIPQPDRGHSVDFYRRVLEVDLHRYETGPTGRFYAVFDDKKRHVVSEATLKDLGLLKYLERLSLSECQITDSDLQYIYIMELSRLQVVDLNGTQITDEGLESIIKIKSLRTLILSDTFVTNEGVANLQRALPDCEVIR